MDIRPVVSLGGYKLDTVVYNDLGSTEHGFHVPYMVGAVVKGPKGGKYMLDDYLVELYLKMCGFEFLRAVDVTNYLIHDGYIRKKTVCVKDGITSEDTARNAGKLLKCKTMSREKGIEKLREWAQS